MNDNPDNEQFDLENTIQASVPFQYPEQEPEQNNLDQLNEFVWRLISFTVPSQNPRLVLISLAYATGFDVGTLLGCDNTITGIAKHMGVTKSTFTKSINTVCEQLNINHKNTGKNNETKETYRKSNHR